ncbi:MAG TPA: hypothetical protein VGC41_24625 [Kofleriaceae bacterium]
MRMAVAMIVLAGACGHDSAQTGGDDDDAPADGGGLMAGDGGAQGETAVKLTMNHRPQNPGQVSYLVAYRDGAGAWKLATAPTGDVYELPIHSSVYSIAWTCIGTVAANSAIRQVSILSFAVADRTELAIDVPPRCSDPGGLVTLKGAVANPGVIDTYAVRWGDRQAAVNNGQYSLQVPPGTHDLVLLEASMINVGDPQPSGAFVKRNVQVAGATQVDLDANAVADVQSFGVDNLITGKAVTTLYANGTTVPLLTETTPQFDVASLAANQMAGTDIYDLVLTGTGGSRSLATTKPADLSWTDVPALGTVTATVATAQPYPQLASTWPAYPNALGYTWAATQTITSGQGSAQVVWTAQLSASVIGMAGAFTMPDFSQLAGWNPSLQLVPNRPITGGVQAHVSSVPGDFPPITPPTSGTQRTMAAGTFAVTP